MTITLRLSAEVERRLLEEAARNGLTVEEYVQRMAEQSVSANRDPAAIPQAEWEAEFRAWAASHKPLPYLVDDDRGGRASLLPGDE